MIFVDKITIELRKTIFKFTKIFKFKHDED